MEENNKPPITIVSNHIGLNGSPSDRIYGDPFGSVYLIQQDYTRYEGKITKKSITIQSTVDGRNMKSFVYITDDGRWFDRAGIPMLPKNEQLDKEDNDDRNTD